MCNRDWWEGVWGRSNLPQKSPTVLSEPKFGPPLIKTSWIRTCPGYLSDKMESIQKRALKIISSCADSYSDAVELARAENIVCRRDRICKKYMCKMKALNHPLRPLLPTRLDDTFPYTLRHKSILLQKRHCQR